MKRTKEEIVVKILETCLMESSKTHIVYKSNLNFSIAAQYLDILTNNGLIAAIDGKYKTTEKGKEILATIKKVHEFL